MKKAIYIIYLAIVILTSCKKTPIDDRFQGVRLKYRYVLNNQNADLFESEVHRITAYVFDQDSLFYGSYSGGGEWLNSSFVMDVPLEVGKYTVVAWGGERDWTYSIGEITDPNLHTFRPTLIKGETTLSNFRLKLNNYKEGMLNQLYLTEKPTDLYYGILNNVEINPLSSAVIKNIDLIKNTNKITVVVEGLENLPVHKKINQNEEDDQKVLLDVYCIAKNGLYKYDNKIAATARQIVYMTPQSIVRKSTLSVELTILRLIVGESPRLVVFDPNSNETLVDNNIIDQILKSPQYNSQVDIDKEDDYEFKIALDRNLEIKTYINGWEIIDVSPEVK